MAAAEYYLGTAGAQQLQTQMHPQPYPRPPNQQPSYPYGQQPPPSSAHLAPQYNTPRPSYSPMPQQRPPYPSQSQQTLAPYPHTPPPQPYGSAPSQSQGYLGPPIQPMRSHSQPPKVHFEDEASSSSDSPSSTDRERRRHRHKHHHSHSHRSRSRSSSLERDRDRSGGRHRHRSHSKTESKDRDTFLGAGGGAIIGDAIFPGLGTAAGLLLGGYGGRRHAEKRSRSEMDVGRHGRRRAGSYEERGGEGVEHDRHGGTFGKYWEGRRDMKDGWDEDSKTFKKGFAVR